MCAFLVLLHLSATYIAAILHLLVLQTRYLLCNFSICYLSMIITNLSAMSATYVAVMLTAAATAAATASDLASGCFSPPNNRKG